MTSFEPVIFGCVGLGGFAGAISGQLLANSHRPNARDKLIAVCDPEPDRNPQRVATLAAAGVKIYRDFDQFLNEPIEAVWLPVPIDLHRRFTERALQAGKAVMCEKPAAGCIDDVDSMIAARDRNKLHVAIGFQDVYQPAMINLKHRLMRGDFGRPVSATLVAAWPRGQSYYHRNDWAGKLRHHGTWVLDSPANNALAHYVHLVMYLLGDAPDRAARPLQIQAELYRANPIENYDTCSMRVRLSCGIDFVLALTHACAVTLDSQIQIATDQGAIIDVLASKLIRIQTTASSESIPVEGNRYANVIGAFTARLRGDPLAPPGGTLEMARSHTTVVNGASQAAGVADVPADWISTVATREESNQRVIREIVPTLQECVRRRQLLCQSGLAPWALPAGSALDVSDYRHFPGPRSIAKASV